MYLSLIVPFYNRDVSSLTLLKTLTELSLEGIEIILVDDGSTDNTYLKLSSYKDSFPDQNIQLIRQCNKGPGGARNAGLKLSRAKYVWFVDSDDDITQEAVDFIKENSAGNYDVIHFNYLARGVEKSGLEVGPGNYINATEVRAILLGSLVPLWSNVYRREMLIDNDIYYPEYCYYEDNSLDFIYPFFVKSLLNTNILAYKYNEENDSIVRSKPNPRTLDRLYTAEYGFKEGLKHALNKEEIDILEKLFVRLYLVNSVGKYTTIKPSKQWIVMWRIMKNYRRLAKDLNINDSFFDAYNNLPELSSKFRLFLYFHWLFSYILPGNTAKYFDNVRRKAWQ
uniref:glycosyltransferase family 2 protein n=2 Tax=Psychrobacter sp. DAB_AL32B TaxID=1028414 RepID=UPI0010AFC5C1|nr:glycosyltransferase [Psychrobacter sp. DAB_AL32B]QBQ68689.1 glycosyltransferase [Psychrobacter sp. DAB_AL32B]